MGLCSSASECNQSPPETATGNPRSSRLTYLEHPHPLAAAYTNRSTLPLSAQDIGTGSSTTSPMSALHVGAGPSSSNERPVLVENPPGPNGERILSIGYPIHWYHWAKDKNVADESDVPTTGPDHGSSSRSLGENLENEASTSGASFTDLKGNRRTTGVVEDIDEAVGKESNLETRPSSGGMLSDEISADADVREVSPAPASVEQTWDMGSRNDYLESPAQIGIETSGSSSIVDDLWRSPSESSDESLGRGDYYLGNPGESVAEPSSTTGDENNRSGSPSKSTVKSSGTSSNRSGSPCESTFEWSGISSDDNNHSGSPRERTAESPSTGDDCLGSQGETAAETSSGTSSDDNYRSGSPGKSTAESAGSMVHENNPGKSPGENAVESAVSMVHDNNRWRSPGESAGESSGTTGHDNNRWRNFGESAAESSGTIVDNDEYVNTLDGSDYVMGVIVEKIRKNKASGKFRWFRDMPGR